MEVDAIVFGAADATLVSAIEGAVAEGMLCVEMDSPSGAKGTNVICIDNYSAAAQGAEWVGEYLEGKGQVILINGDPTILLERNAATVILRRSGELSK